MNPIEFIRICVSCVCEASRSREVQVMALLGYSLPVTFFARKHSNQYA